MNLDIGNNFWGPITAKRGQLLPSLGSKLRHSIPLNYHLPGELYSAFQYLRLVLKEAQERKRHES